MFDISISHTKLAIILLPFIVYLLFDQQRRGEDDDKVEGNRVVVHVWIIQQHTYIQEPFTPIHSFISQLSVH